MNPLNTLINDPNKYSILGRVVRITDDVIQYRKSIRKRFSTGQSGLPKVHPLDFTVPVLDNGEFNSGELSRHEANQKLNLIVGQTQTGRANYCNTLDNRIKVSNGGNCFQRT